MIVAVKNIAMVWLQQQQGCQQETPFNQQDEDYKKCSFNSLICQNKSSTYIDCFHLHDNDYACHIVIRVWKNWKNNSNRTSFRESAMDDKALIQTFLTMIIEKNLEASLRISMCYFQRRGTKSESGRSFREPPCHEPIRKVMQSSLSKFTTTRNPGELSSERQLFCFQKTWQKKWQKYLRHSNLKALLNLWKRSNDKKSKRTLYEVIVKLLLTFKLKSFHWFFSSFPLLFSTRPFSFWKGDL